jgi:hypothetical protein
MPIPFITFDSRFETLEDWVLHVTGLMDLDIFQDHNLPGPILNRITRTDFGCVGYLCGCALEMVKKPQLRIIYPCGHTFHSCSSRYVETNNFLICPVGCEVKGEVMVFKTSLSEPGFGKCKLCGEDASAKCHRSTISSICGHFIHVYCLPGNYPIDEEIHPDLDPIDCGQCLKSLPYTLCFLCHDQMDYMDETIIESTVHQIFDHHLECREIWAQKGFLEYDRFQRYWMRVFKNPILHQIRKIKLLDYSEFLSIEKIRNFKF